MRISAEITAIDPVRDRVYVGLEIALERYDDADAAILDALDQANTQDGSPGAT